MSDMSGKGKETQKSLVERATEWIGSVPSLVIHTVLFVTSFLLGVFHIAPWGTVLLVLTTIVSLEAIYLSIFIQMTVNRHSIELEEVSEDVDEIQEDIEEINEDVDEIQKDVDEIQEDVEEMSEEDQEIAAHHTKQLVTLEQLTKDLQRVLVDIETFKKQ